ncbi:hypothetical protein H4J56_18210 [Colwellia sp. BRX8-4]|uniref:hypothetical protein n=1 Tax=Colwellia sp. BRX8-4 TaxID=2759836 RepID=UPI0015F764EE|nr:hypothetical protein [Colwellia sp. BRX8-4]MBA6373353.1 hypothetical protein [Colwellia sp. BRX8-4]
MKFEISVDTGMLLTNDKHAETHVYSTNSNVGKVETTQIHSQVLTNQEFWLKKNDGSEKLVSLLDQSVEARINHNISIVSIDNGDTGYYCGYVNHNTKKKKSFDLESIAENFIDNSNFKAYYFLVVFFASIALGFMFDEFIVFAGCFFLGMGGIKLALFLKRFSLYQQLEVLVEPQLKELMGLQVMITPEEVQQHPAVEIS